MRTCNLKKGHKLTEYLTEPIDYALEHLRYVLNNARVAHNGLITGNIVSPNQRREDAAKRLLNLYGGMIYSGINDGV